MNNIRMSAQYNKARGKSRAPIIPTRLAEIYASICKTDVVMNKRSDDVASFVRLLNDAQPRNVTERNAKRTIFEQFHMVTHESCPTFFDLVFQNPKFSPQILWGRATDILHHFEINHIAEELALRWISNKGRYISAYKAPSSAATAATSTASTVTIAPATASPAPAATTSNATTAPAAPAASTD